MERDTPNPMMKAGWRKFARRIAQMMNKNWYEIPAGELPRLRMDKLDSFGFQHYGDGYIHEESLLDGAFRLYVRVADDGTISSLLLDSETQEPYVLHLVESAEGAFVGSVRTAYHEALNRVGECCGEHGAFHGKYVDDILNYVWDNYGDEIEYPWKDMDAAVIRSHVSRKWYAVFMKILPVKIGLGGRNPIRIMNLHGTAEQVTALVDGARYFPGWHMNRKYWYTVCLDGSIPMEELQRRIDESFVLSQPKGHKK